MQLDFELSKLHWLPATHNITVTRKDLCQTTDNHISILKHSDITKVSNGLIDHDHKVIFVSKLA